MLEEKIKIERFKDRMLLELEKNRHKGTILATKDFNFIVTELEYHKAKMLIAVRINNKQALKEYIADTANFLFALGNLGGLYDDNFIDNSTSFELNKDIEVFKEVNTPTLNQTLTII